MLFIQSYVSFMFPLKHFSYISLNFIANTTFKEIKEICEHIYKGLKIQDNDDEKIIDSTIDFIENFLISEYKTMIKIFL